MLYREGVFLLRLATDAESASGALAPGSVGPAVYDITVMTTKLSSLLTQIENAKRELQNLINQQINSTNAGWQAAVETLRQQIGAIGSSRVEFLYKAPNRSLLLPAGGVWVWLCPNWSSRPGKNPTGTLPGGNNVGAGTQNDMYTEGALFFRSN